ncbi:glycosyltransferase family 4 protein [Lacibacter sediminis]|uniref:Glycosyltransferase family 4 protein n=1 Tax=Lacibacter sediminis TaxID=2760713 RepID=A0A7G5XHM2_9BACT|nr:glycosyltransferase family 4 protein [Lacibacter sediminis]QNA44975.1 glycosyltransferase family 4 protein [Lacibacter sediminis]
MQKKKISFFVLTAFSHMGGIEKFNRAFMKGLADLSSTLHLKSTLGGMYDHSVDKHYVDQQTYHAFKGKKLQFVLWAIKQSLQQDVIVLGHLNLAPIAVLLKMIAPKKKLIIICHGVEVFEPVSGFKKKALQQADHVLAVSSFTKDKLVTKQGLSNEKIMVFPNTIDPFFNFPVDFAKPGYLQQRYGIAAHEKVILTLTRLNSNEGYKGYDTLVTVLPELLKQNIPFKYILAGKADATELQRMNTLIKSLGLEQQVMMPGFIADKEITDHYLLADVFVMPSKGEGFGIVYTEAMACGLPVIAGNKDGSTEALQFGELGTLIDPDSADELKEALVKVLHEQHEPLQVQQRMLEYFSFEKFKERLKTVLEGV